VRSVRGKHGGTYAHWQIGLEYPQSPIIQTTHTCIVNQHLYCKLFEGAGAPIRFWTDQVLIVNAQREVADAQQQAENHGG